MNLPAVGLLVCLTAPLLVTGLAKKPHIVFILADDLGWNDVGFHGSNQIPTPNLDALAFSGLILDRYYVTPICTPSRAALMTGKYPIHNGMQHTVLYAAEPRGLPLTEKLLPQYLKELGYMNHIVGKWHLGHYKKVYTPLYRGFDSHIGFWSGRQDYFDHTSVEKPSWGFDMRRGMDVAYDLHGKYLTDIISQESVRVVKNHNSSIPLFLYIAHGAVHSGNAYNALPAPDEKVDKLRGIDEFNRRKFGAMMSSLDDSVGEVVAALASQGMLEDTIIIFSTDNGGPAAGFNINAASNWPLRGVKNTLWEGGVRGAGFIWSPLIKKSPRVARQTMHITDWLPTLYAAAGGNTDDLGEDLDGVSLWEELREDTKSVRSHILHNIDDIWGSAALTVGDWKVVKGTNYNGAWDGWYGPAGDREPMNYTFDLLKTSPAGKVVQAMHLLPTDEEILDLRKSSGVDCKKNLVNPMNQCWPLESPCLFNVQEDPCELSNVARKFPNILSSLLAELNKYNQTVVPPSNKALDPRADPRFWDNVWTNFGDYSFHSRRFYDDMSSSMEVINIMPHNSTET
ncbi:arylsulfatase B [Phlebotomus argentipes]|uniref:arylsulfatase B n=1 Tax=Phlebotomus argentipes TaxID=94469 RepID=UPI002892AB3C|nr:arylsulfatase B [Phlebotomus argentipes]